MKLEGKVLFGTGHRPEKLGPVRAVYEDVTYAAVKAIAPDWGIVGMARGFDLALGRVLIDLGIPFVAAIPFKGHSGGWAEEDRAAFEYVAQLATQTKYVCEPGYAKWKYAKRNQWMVDCGTEGIALWDGSLGGTSNCVNYAVRKSVKYTNIWGACVDAQVKASIVSSAELPI